MTIKEPFCNPARSVECYRGPGRYDAEVQVMWLGKQWVIKTRCSSREDAQAESLSIVNGLHDKIEALILAEMAKFKQAED